MRKVPCTMTTILPSLLQILESPSVSVLSSSSSAMLRTQFLFQMQMLTKENMLYFHFPEFPLPGNGSGLPCSYLVNPSLASTVESGNSCHFSSLSTEFGTGAWKHWVNWLGAAWPIQLHGVIRLDRVFVVDQSHLRSELKSSLVPFIFLILELQLSWVLTGQLATSVESMSRFYSASLLTAFVQHQWVKASNQIL